MSYSSSSYTINIRHVANVAGSLGAFIGLNSLYGLLDPRGALNQLGFPTPVSPSDQDMADGLTRMFSASRLVVASAQIAAWHYGDYKVLGWQMTASVIMAVVDGYVSKKVIGKGEWFHWGSAPVGLFLGIYLVSST